MNKIIKMKKRKYVLNYSELVTESLENSFLIKSTLNEAIKFISNNNWINLYRGERRDSEMSPLYYNIPKEKRRARLAKKYDSIYNIWMSSDESWSEYPIRNSRCTFTTTDIKYAKSYGLVNLVIPIDFDSIKYGICPDLDMFDSFQESGIPDLHIFSDIIQEAIFSQFGYYAETYEDLLDTLNDVGEFEFRKNSTSDSFKIPKALKDFSKLDKSIKFVNYLRKLLRPENNNFNLEYGMKNLHSLLKNNPSSNEVWFNGDSIFLSIPNEYDYGNGLNKEQTIEIINKKIIDYL